MPLGIKKGAVKNRREKTSVFTAFYSGLEFAELLLKYKVKSFRAGKPRSNFRPFNPGILIYIAIDIADYSIHEFQTVFAVYAKKPGAEGMAGNPFIGENNMTV